MTPADRTLLGLWRELSPSSRGSYREGWRRWCEWCSTVAVDPIHANQTEAQAWIDHQRHNNIAASTIRRRADKVKLCLEYLAMLGHRPYEPFRLCVLPASHRRGPKPTCPTHEILSTERIARALFATRVHDRAHCVLWAGAGMGLSAADLVQMSAAKIVRVGDTPVAVIQRAGRGHLIPVPREIMLIIDRSGWPLNSVNAAAIRDQVKRAVGPHLGTSTQELRRWHQQTAISLGVDLEQRANGGDRLKWSSHPSVVVCAHLRDCLLTFMEKSA